MTAVNLTIQDGRSLGYRRPVIWEIPTERGSISVPWLVYVGERGTLQFAPSTPDRDPQPADEPHGWTVTEHDRTVWRLFGSGYKAPLYLTCESPNGEHWEVLWDTVGFPFVAVWKPRKDAP